MPFYRYISLFFIIYLSFISIKTAAQSYCDADHTSGCAMDFIDGVELNTISNLSTGCSPGTYTYYAGISTTLLAGGQYVLYITSGNYTSNYYYAWIDYNDDGDFADANEYLGSIHSSDRYQRNSIDFTVPNTSNATTRLRIRCTYLPSYYQPCGSYTYGETEDYVIYIRQYFGSSVVTQISTSDDPYGFFEVFDFEDDDKIEFLYVWDDFYLGAHVLRNRIFNSTQAAAILDDMGAQSVSFIDYDQDKDLDIFAVGENYDGDAKTHLLQNSNYSFSNIDSRILYLHDSRQDWQDFDNDGDMDLLISGYHTILGYVSKIYQNNNGEFIEYFSTGTDYGDVGWFDFENDGDFDAFIGNSIYNNHELTFSRDITLPSKGGLGIGDYDSDGDMDIILGNKIFSNNITGISLAFTLDTTTITNNCWGDYDNDGDLDLLHNNTIFQNNGSEFTETNMTGFPVVENVNQWYDENGDNKLDIFYFSSGVKAAINQSHQTNTRPTVPTGLNTKYENGIFTMSWNPASDNETATEGLTYNIYLGTSGDTTNIIHPLADPDDGRRYISSFGNVGHHTSWQVNNLPNGKYFWAVQAIDNAYAGSDFPIRQLFTISDFTNDDLDDRPSHFPQWDINVIDYDQDNDLDFLYLGSGGNYTDNPKHGSFFLHSNNGDNTFTLLKRDIIEWVPLYNWPTEDFSPKSNFYDKENDNVPDLFINHIETVPEIAWIKKYLVIEFVDEDYTLCETCDSIIPWQAECIDFDNDCDFDALFNDTLFINNNGIFEYFQYIPGSSDAAAWGDFDNDGDLDLAAGNQIYQNNSAEFTILDFHLQYIADKLEWTDVNHDGFLDLIYCKRNDPSIFQILQNNHHASFSPLEIELSSDVKDDYDFTTGDLDSDYDPDFVLCATNITISGTFNRTQLITNNIPGTESPPNAPTNLRVVRDQLDVILQWDEATDAQSLNNMSYNLRLGTQKDSTNLMSPLSDLETGFLYVPKLGNIQLNKSWRIKNIPKGKYYWSVQAIDKAYNGGPWAPLDSFEVTHVNPEFTWDTVCLNDTTHFTNNSATSDTIIAWVWDFDDGQYETIVEPTHLYDAAGIYEVTLWAFTASGDSSWITHLVEVYNIPTAGFSVETACIGESSEFTNLSDTGTINVASWVWDFGNGETSATRGNVSKTFVDNTTTTLTITADNGCSDQYEQEVFIVKNPLINLESDSVLKCPADEVLFSISNFNQGVDYLWYNNEILMDILNTDTYSGSTHDGEYYVKASMEGCSLESNRIYVANKTAPPNPALYANDGPNEYLIVSSNRNASFYQWFYNGELIPGANDYYYLVYTDYGEYYVEIIEPGYECKARSESIKIPDTYTDIKNNALEQLLEIYPNPAKDKATLLWVNPYSGKFSIQLFDIMGTLVYTEQNYKTEEEYEQIINLENFVPGIYYIRIITDKIETEKKFVIEK